MVLHSKCCETSPVAAFWRSITTDLVVSQQIVECCGAAEGGEAEMTACDSAIVVYEVDQIAQAGFVQSVLALQAPYAGPVSMEEAERQRNASTLCTNPACAI